MHSLRLLFEPRQTVGGGSAGSMAVLVVRIRRKKQGKRNTIFTILVHLSKRRREDSDEWIVVERRIMSKKRGFSRIEEAPTVLAHVVVPKLCGPNPENTSFKIHAHVVQIVTAGSHFITPRYTSHSSLEISSTPSVCHISFHRAGPNGHGGTNTIRSTTPRYLDCLLKDDHRSHNNHREEEARWQSTDCAVRWEQQGRERHTSCGRV